MDPMQLPLRDVHYPGTVSWWPPAPGWWILLGLLVITVAVIWWWRRRRRRLQASALRKARQEFMSMSDRYASDNDARTLVRDISVLLRRLSISIYPRTDVASLTGEAWLSFLDQSLPARPFSTGPGRVLLDAPYRPEVSPAEADPLLEICSTWLDKAGELKQAGYHD